MSLAASCQYCPLSLRSEFALRSFSILAVRTFSCFVVRGLPLLVIASSLLITSSIHGQVMSGTRGAFFRCFLQILSDLDFLPVSYQAMFAPVVANIYNLKKIIMWYYDDYMTIESKKG